MNRVKQITGTHHVLIAIVIRFEYVRKERSEERDSYLNNGNYFDGNSFLMALIPLGIANIHIRVRYANPNIEHQ